MAFTWLHFSGEHLDTLKLPKVARLSDNRFENRLREIGHLHAEGAPRGQIEAELLALLYAIRAEAMPRGNKLVADVKEYIRTRAAAAPTVAAVAAAFSYSPDHLSRLYRREVGVSLKEAIAEERLSLCRRYLLTTSLSLGEIAALTAFPDANTLTKFFTYHVGISPLAYRARVYAGHTNIR